MSTPLAIQPAVAAQTDPALTARTFLRNSTLTAALARVQAQRAAQQAETFRNQILSQRAARIEQAYQRDLAPCRACGVNTGAETDGSDALDNRGEVVQ